MDGQQVISLDGEWSLAYGEVEFGAQVGGWATTEALGWARIPAQVPGNFELDLYRAGREPERFFGLIPLAYQKFERPNFASGRMGRAAGRVGAEAELVFHGLDCFADIYLNGELIGRTDNMLIEHRFAVGGKLRPENELFIHLRPAFVAAEQYDYTPGSTAGAHCYEAMYVRKAPHMYGWDIMPRFISAGLWRSVELQYLAPERLEIAFLENRAVAAERATLQLCYQAHLIPKIGDKYEIEVIGECGAYHFSTRQPALFKAGRLVFDVKAPALWWPRGRGAASLYAVTVQLLKNGQELDAKRFRHGIRTVALERTATTNDRAEGEFVFKVNGEKVFINGSNWVPLDALHSRDAERVERALALVEDCGCNMLRCWGGNVYESDHFFDLCDEKGILIWQDFALACAVYPHDPEFKERLAAEARAVVRRLRSHACLALWAGDNECDSAHKWNERGDPNRNVLTRQVLPEVLKAEDPTRPYLPSSPFIDSAAFARYGHNEAGIPEQHLWGPRDYYKSTFYTGSNAHFASEIGYHGCPSPESLKKFLSPDKLWPGRDNPEWLLHCTDPRPETFLYGYRVELMYKQVRELFGIEPRNLDEFAFASQVAQAEAKKFFVELFRTAKWRRTGILWWNILDGWPQLSDAVVDYYWDKKLAYHFLKAVQQPLCLMLREPSSWGQDLVAANDRREDLVVNYKVRELGGGKVVAEGQGTAKGDATTVLGRVPFFAGEKKFYLIEWTAGGQAGRNHYLAGHPPFDLEQYRGWLREYGMLKEIPWAGK